MGKQSKEYWRQYYAANRQKIIDRAVTHQQQHADERKSYLAQYNSANRERLSEQKRQYRENTKDERNSERRRQYASDPDMRDKSRKAAAQWQRDNPEKRLAQRLKPFGITPEQYRAMLERQCGRCAICGINKPDKVRQRFHTDHCHETGVVRGLLCANCNTGLGKFADSPELLERAALYLRTSIGPQDSDK